MTKIIFNINNVNTELTNIYEDIIIFNESGEHHYYKGKLHCENGPAEITTDCCTWMKNGLITRDDGPAVTCNKYTIWVSSNLDKTWMKNELTTSVIWNFHQWIFYNINKNSNYQRLEYWKDNKLHRDDGPAIIF